MDLRKAASNVLDKAVIGHLADLRRMPRDVLAAAPNATLYRYRPSVPGEPSGPPVLLVPPLGAPDFAYDLRRGCSLLADGGLTIGTRRLDLAGVRVPVLIVAGQDDVIAPLKAVRRITELLTGAPEVRFEAAPGGHLGVLTGRRARDTTWRYLGEFLDGAPASDSPASENSGVVTTAPDLAATEAAGAPALRV